MRYVIMAVAGVFAVVNWLNTPDGMRAKQHFMESSRTATTYMPVE